MFHYFIVSLHHCIIWNIECRTGNSECRSRCPTLKSLFRRILQKYTTTGRPKFYPKIRVSLYRSTARSNRGAKQRNCVRTERENKHEVVRVTGAQQLPCAVTPFFWFVFFGGAKKDEQIINLEYHLAFNSSLAGLFSYKILYTESIIGVGAPFSRLIL